jgi:hypothetical protein
VGRAAPEHDDPPVGNAPRTRHAVWSNRHRGIHGAVEPREDVPRVQPSQGHLHGDRAAYVEPLDLAVPADSSSLSVGHDAQLVDYFRDPLRLASQTHRARTLVRGPDDAAQGDD